MRGRFRLDRRRAGLAALALPVAAGGAWVGSLWRDAHTDSARNYRIEYAAPAGWEEIPHSPQALFLYKHKRSGLLLRGATVRVLSDENPTPFLDAEALADYFIDRTEENMPGWTARKLEPQPAKGAVFSLIDRRRKGKRVVTAYGVKGNTTFLVTLSANAGELGHFESALPQLRTFLANVRFVEHVYR